MCWQGHSDQLWGGYTYAQHGEDHMLLNLFWQMGINKPSYFDIGAHHPFNISNTALFYQHGSTGINVEANPNLIEAFEQSHPNDINLNIGVGPETGILPFYMFDEQSGRNTFSLEEATKFVSDYPQYPVRAILEIEVKTINEVIKQYANGQYPDFLSIDIEGLDYAVLASADFTQSKPKIICVELFKEEAQATKDILAKSNYSPLCWMPYNLIFVDNEYIEMVR